MKEDGMLANAAKQGDKLAEVLRRQAGRSTRASARSRGKGLMFAIECVKPGTKEPNAAAAKAFIAECIKRNVIVMGAGAFGNCVRFLPPLNISDAEMDIALGVFDEAAKVAFA